MVYRTLSKFITENFGNTNNDDYNQIDEKNWISDHTGVDVDNHNNEQLVDIFNGLPKWAAKQEVEELEAEIEQSKQSKSKSTVTHKNWIFLAIHQKRVVNLDLQVQRNLLCLDHH